MMAEATNLAAGDPKKGAGAGIVAVKLVVTVSVWRYVCYYASWVCSVLKTSNPFLPSPRISS